MQVFCQIHKLDSVSKKKKKKKGLLPPSEAFSRAAKRPDWSKNVSALMDWNVNWHIYHRVESKLFTRDMVTGCPGLPGAPPAAPRGRRQSSSCGVSVTTSCLSAAAAWRGFSAPAAVEEKLKTTRYGYWNARKTCVLLRWRKKKWWMWRRDLADRRGPTVPSR